MSTIGKNLIRVLAVFVTVITVMTGGNVLRAEAAGRTVSIESCLINGDQVVCKLKASALPASEDGLFYIYGNEVFQDGPSQNVVATITMGTEVTINFPLQYNTGGGSLI